MTLIERFMKFVVKDDHGCWIWTGFIQWNGYGMFWMLRKNRKAHRISHELFVSDIPEGKHVLHRCDVRRCVNPKHLFLGDQVSNNADMWAKGRGAIGEAKKQKLTGPKVDSIRARYAAGETQLSIAEDVGIHQVTVSEIVTRKIWKHRGVMQ